MMKIAIFEPVGTERGVSALETIGSNDWSGIFLDSYNPTNTPDVRNDWHPGSTPASDIDATLLEATGRYDDLLRKLAE